jgi:O-antigen ligase
MKTQLLAHNNSVRLFYVYALIVCLGIGASIFFESPIPIALPASALMALILFLDYRYFFYLLFFSIPLSTEVYIGDTLGTDLPTEPLIVLLLLIYIVCMIIKPKYFSRDFLRHPISLFLLYHFIWTCVTAIFSEDIAISAKFILAKAWYIAAFYLMSGHILTRTKYINVILWLVTIPLAIATLKVILHHATLNFGFKRINESTSPFFRNHVNYAAILSTFLPYIVYLYRTSIPAKTKSLLLNILIIIGFGIVTSYTRAAYVAIAMAYVTYWIIRLRLSKLVLTVSVVLIIGVINFLIIENQFMKYVPTEKTVAHTELSDIVNSTSKLEDVSTMERYYRWIAGLQMIYEKPLLGFGPGNFYSNYKKYTLERFSTYVSNNPEKSGIHNYYLMITVEQGIIGLIVFLSFIILAFVYGENLYHRLQDKNLKRLVMASMLSSLIIYAFLIMNDLIETDKIGSFFFFNLAILAIIDIQNRSRSVGPMVSSEEPLDTQQEQNQ